jgi:hypothetical protein
LYARAHARDEALGLLRGAAIARITAALRLPPESTPAEIAVAVEAATGAPIPHTSAVLFDGRAEDDNALTNIVSALDQLQDLVMRGSARPTVNEGDAR